MLGIVFVKFTLCERTKIKEIRCVIEKHSRTTLHKNFKNRYFRQFGYEVHQRKKLAVIILFWRRSIPKLVLSWTNLDNIFGFSSLIFAEQINKLYSDLIHMSEFAVILSQIWEVSFFFSADAQLDNLHLLTFILHRPKQRNVL